MTKSDNAAPVAPRKISLNNLVKVLKCHPRTIVRAMTGQANPACPAGYNPNFDLETVALIFDCEEKTLIDALTGRDKLLTQPEAADFFGIHVRNFRARGYKKAVKKGKIVRYSRYQIANESIARFG